MLLGLRGSMSKALGLFLASGTKIVRLLSTFRNRIKEGVSALSGKVLSCFPIIVRNEKRSPDVPLVSVVIPCFNYGKYVEQAIDTVLAQSFSNFEIIVIDGGSTDAHTLEVMRSLRKAKTKILLREGRHLVGDNRNYGIANSRGRYICCLDADDMIEPTYLEKAVYLLESHNLDVVYPGVQCFGDDSRYWPALEADFKKSMTTTNAVPTAAVFRRSAWEKAGGYRDWGIGKDYVFEDWEFWTRLLGHGFLFRPIDEPLMHYRVHGSGLASGATMSYERQREIIRESCQDLAKIYRRSFFKRYRRYKIEAPLINLVGSEYLKPGKNIIILVESLQNKKDIDTVRRTLQWARRCHCERIILVSIGLVDKQKIVEKLSDFTLRIYSLSSFLRTKMERKEFLHYLILANSICVLINLEPWPVERNYKDFQDKYPSLTILGEKDFDRQEELSLN